MHTNRHGIVRTCFVSRLSRLQLDRGEWAVALFNRSPGPDTITVDFRMLEGAMKDQAFDVRDVWAGRAQACRGCRGSYTSAVGAHDTALLILTPV